LEITNIDPGDELIVMRGQIINPHGQTVIEGIATATLLRGFKRIQWVRKGEKKSAVPGGRHR
jgi:hypothetical protein